MSVVTIAGQAGSGSAEFGERLAKSIGYKLVNRGVFTTVLKEYGIVNTEKLLDTPPSLFERFEKFGKERQEAINLLNKIYLCFAKQGNVVIVSEKAYLVLHSYINVLNVFLESPLEDRIKNVVINNHVSREEAEKIVLRGENVRIKFIESFYHNKWDSFLPFSLVVNTHTIGLDLTEKIVKEAATRLGTYGHHVKLREEGEYSYTDEIEVDPVLESFIKQLLSTL